MTMVALAITSLAMGGSVLDLQAHVLATLHGEAANSVTCQQELGNLMGWRASSAEGILVYGDTVSVQDLDVQQVGQEVGSAAPVRNYFEVSGSGEVELYVPVAEGEEIEVYRRLTSGLYVRVLTTSISVPGYIKLDALNAGRYVVRTVDAYSYPTEIESLSQWEALPTPSAAPEAKAEWCLTPVNPDRVAGPIPIVLIHGMRTDPWPAFAYWAATSAEAASFREHFQLWDFVHPTEGVNAAIGFSPEYPGFSESMAAYLNRFIIEATQHGVTVGDTTYRFPAETYGMLTHGQGGLVARALLKNFPSHLERVFAVITLDAPHMGAPFATPEWFRHTVTRLGFSKPTQLECFLEGVFVEYFFSTHFTTERQSDLDMGWANYDARGGFGMPYLTFKAWRPEDGFVTLCLSPMDANQTDAGSLAGYEDPTSEPASHLATYCGGLDAIMPSRRGDLGLDKFFVYGGFIDTNEDWRRLVLEGTKTLELTYADVPASLGLRFSSLLMSFVASPGSDAPCGVYAINDGVVPLQSQLFLDGEEQELIYATKIASDGSRTPVFPIELRSDVIAQHTLVNPQRIRLMRGWSHVDAATGRYDATTGTSELFSSVAADFLSVAPEEY